MSKPSSDMNINLGINPINTAELVRSIGDALIEAGTIISDAADALTAKELEGSAGFADAVAQAEQAAEVDGRGDPRVVAP